jgi:hypothetical protein
MGKASSFSFAKKVPEAGDTVSGDGKLQLYQHSCSLVQKKILLSINVIQA